MPETNDKKVIIELEEVHKIYQMGTEQVNALAGVSIKFHEGDYWAIMGPSGSGKSTMLNILGCLDHVTKGRYTLEGNDVNDLDDDQLSHIRLKYLGFVFQSFNLIPQLTVQRNIELPLYYLGWDAHKSAERAIELAESVGLEKRLGHKQRNFPAVKCRELRLRVHWRMIHLCCWRMSQRVIWTQALVIRYSIY